MSYIINNVNSELHNAAAGELLFYFKLGPMSVCIYVYILCVYRLCGEPFTGTAQSSLLCLHILLNSAQIFNAQIVFPS